MVTSTVVTVSATESYHTLQEGSLSLYWFDDQGHAVGGSSEREHIVAQLGKHMHDILARAQLGECLPTFAEHGHGLGMFALRLRHHAKPMVGRPNPHRSPTDRFSAALSSSTTWQERKEIFPLPEDFFPQLRCAQAYSGIGGSNTPSSALISGILLGLVWAGYHIPGFIISGFYSFEWIFWHVIYTIAGRVLFVWIYNNAGKSLFSMALFHSTFGLFWILWPATDNLQKATSYYDPRIAAFIAISYVVIVTLLWGSKTLAQYRFARSGESHVADKNKPITAGK
jgi:hypothetical protein